MGSPRDVGGVRSDLLFAILDALREAGSRSPPATTSVAQAQREPPAEPPPLSERA